MTDENPTGLTEPPPPPPAPFGAPPAETPPESPVAAGEPPTLGPGEDPNAVPVPSVIPAASADYEMNVEHHDGTGTDLLHYTGDHLDADQVTQLAKAAGRDVIAAPDLILEWVDGTGRHYHWRIQVAAEPVLDPVPDPKEA